MTTYFVPARPTNPHAPHTYVTTKTFLSHFGFDTLRDLPDIEALEDAGLLSKEKLLTGNLPIMFGIGAADDDPNELYESAADIEPLV